MSDEVNVITTPPADTAETPRDEHQGEAATPAAAPPPESPPEPAPAAVPEPVVADMQTAPAPEPEPPAPAAPAAREEDHPPEPTPAPAPAAAEEIHPDLPHPSTPGTATAEPAPEPAPVEQPPENRKHWYVVKVQSGREDTIKEAIERRVKKEGLDQFYGQIVIPVEKVTEVKVDKNGKRVTKTKERKLYPGYLMCEVEFNDRILYLFRETSGVGDFVGAQPQKNPQDELKPPSPMSDREVARILGPGHGKPEEEVPLKPKDLNVGDRVRVIDGIFKDMEGTVKAILEAVAKIQVEVTIWGRPTQVELEYYQVEPA
jgi:transcriptional antiterminator NusG